MVQKIVFGTLGVFLIVLGFLWSIPRYMWYLLWFAYLLTVGRAVLFGVLYVQGERTRKLAEQRLFQMRCGVVLRNEEDARAWQQFFKSISW